MRERREREAGRCTALVDTERGTTSVTEAVESAEQGRIDTVFIAADRTAMGRYDAVAARATLDELARVDSEDLLDRLVTRTLQQRGSVHLVPAAEVPGAGLVAAAYRYPVPPAAQEASCAAQNRRL